MLNHPEHLNTPRLVADATGTTVWKWDQQEPFGDSPADENPSSLGAFEFPFRFPGQYFDKETILADNWFRTYDSGTGRYTQSDPIGLVSGLNTYGYANGSPINYGDPTGEAVPIAIAACAANPACAGLAVVTVAVAANAIQGTINAIVGSSPKATVGNVPNSCPAANDPGPEDCVVRQKQLLFYYDYIVKYEAKGGTILPAVKLDYMRQAVVHNVRCRRNPVPTLPGPQGIVR